jgi:hypothetical protein
VSTIRPTQSQSIKLQNPLEVSEEHLDFLAILARLLLRIGRGDLASDIPCRFMEAAIFRIGVFGQQRAFIGQVAQSDWLDR